MACIGNFCDLELVSFTSPGRPCRGNTALDHALYLSCIALLYGVF